MAGKGPAPKPNAIRRNQHPHATTLKAEEQPGRELPRALGIKTSGAKRFWKTWSRAPQTQVWLPTDWAELEITTVLVDRFFQGEVGLASEIRLRVAKWGATPEDRARLRMTFEKLADDEMSKGGPGEPSADDLDEELYRLLSEGAQDSTRQ